MNVTVDQFKSTLQSAGYSLTTARRNVFEALQNQEPQTMHQLVLRCQTVDRASVYRTVSLFEKLGILQRLQAGWKYTLELSDAFHEHHHHATCLRCGASIALPEDDELEQLLRTIAETHGFQVERHQLELQGVCAACQAPRSFA